MFGSLIGEMNQPTTWSAAHEKNGGMNFAYLKTWKHQDVLSHQSLEQLFQYNFIACLMLQCMAMVNARI